MIYFYLMKLEKIFFNYLRDYDNGKLKLYNFSNNYEPV